ncbi:MAG: hypothetical protein KF729_19545 [Sandaracinaceae bacterium]|nr:hypothetical protein [Sandaracinaceae bacterium]
MALANERTRLHIDSVRSPITLEVARRRSDGLVLSQPLPFLKLDTTVTERGRRARIRRVAIAMDGDVPRLLLELHHDGGAAVAEPPAAPAFRPGESTRPERRDSTIPYEIEASARPSRPPIVISDPPPPPAEAAAPVVRASSPAPWLARLWRAFVMGLATLTAP